MVGNRARMEKVFIIFKQEGAETPATDGGRRMTELEKLKRQKAEIDNVIAGLEGLRNKLRGNANDNDD